MSVQAYEWAWGRGVTGAALPVLLAVADYADAQGAAWVGQEKIASMVGTTSRAVRRNLAQLETDGHIRRYRRHRPNGSRTSDLLRLLIVPDGEFDLDVYAGIRSEVSPADDIDDWDQPEPPNLDYAPDAEADADIRQETVEADVHVRQGTAVAVGSAGAAAAKNTDQRTSDAGTTGRWCPAQIRKKNHQRQTAKQRPGKSALTNHENLGQRQTILQSYERAVQRVARTRTGGRAHAGASARDSTPRTITRPAEDDVRTVSGTSEFRGNAQWLLHTWNATHGRDVGLWDATGRPSEAVLLIERALEAYPVVELREWETAIRNVRDNPPEGTAGPAVLEHTFGLRTVARSLSLAEQGSGKRAARLFGDAAVRNRKARGTRPTVPFRTTTAHPPANRVIVGA